MAIISTRVDDITKAEAEKIAEALGIPLSTAINVFLRKFVSESGFPFQVVTKTPVTDVLALDEAVKNAVKNADGSGKIKSFTYLDPGTGTLKKIDSNE